MAASIDSFNVEKHNIRNIPYFVFVFELFVFVFVAPRGVGEYKTPPGDINDGFGTYSVLRF